MSASLNHPELLFRLVAQLLAREQSKTEPECSIFDLTNCDAFASEAITQPRSATYRQASQRLPQASQL